MAELRYEITEDYSDVVLKELEKRKPSILEGFGNELQKSIRNFMIEDEIYDTGRLHWSISYCTPYGDYSDMKEMNMANDNIRGVREKDTVVYGSNVPYANYVETGTTRQRARSYVRIGSYRSEIELKNLLKKKLEGE